MFAVFWCGTLLLLGVFFVGYWAFCLYLFWVLFCFNMLVFMVWTPGRCSGDRSGCYSQIQEFFPYFAHIPVTGLGSVTHYPLKQEA